MASLCYFNSGETMHRFFAAAACAAMLFGLSVAAAPAAGPILGSLVKGGKNPGGNAFMVGLGPQGQRVVVTLHFASVVSYAYDPATSTVTPLPTPMYNSNPIGGIGVVIKKNPGGSAERMPSPVTVDPTYPNLYHFASSIAPGTYDIVVTVQAHAINTKGTGGQNGRMAATGASMTSASATTALPAKTMLLTLHIIVDAEGNKTMNPKMPPTVTTAAPMVPTQ